MGGGSVLLLIWSLVFRGGGATPQQQAEKDQPPLAAAQSAAVEPSASRAAAPAAESKSVPALTDLTGTQVYEEVVGSTVTIHSFHGDTPIGHGSGFILYTGEAIVTNEHVICGASRLVVRYHGGATEEVTVVQNVDANRDIAVLPFSSQKANRLDLHGLVLAPNFPKVGETVYAVGAPQGLEFTFTRGIVSQVRQGFESFGTVIQTDVSLSPGSSGGPLVNGAGQVVGINTLASKSSAEAHNLNFAVAMSEIRTVSQRSNPRALTDLEGYRLFETVVSAANSKRQQEIEGQRQAQLASERKRQQEAEREATRRRLEIEQREREERERELAKKQDGEADQIIASWRMLRRGMTRQEVRNVLGEPLRVNAPTYSEDWEYRYRCWVRGTDISVWHEGHVEFDKWGLVTGWKEPVL